MKLNHLLKNGFVGLLFVALMASCSTSNDVVSSNRIQKRKYNKGFHLNLGKKDKSNTVAITTKANRSTADAKVSDVCPLETAAKAQKENTITTNNTPAKTKHAKAPKHTVSVTTNETTSETTDMSSPVLASKKVNKKKTASQKSSAAPDWLVWVLAILIPFVAVGLVTDWDIALTLICLGLTILGWIPGVIMALIVVNNHI